jgi:hypothetical protein
MSLLTGYAGAIGDIAGAGFRIGGLRYPAARPGA